MYSMNAAALIAFFRNSFEHLAQDTQCLLMQNLLSSVMM
jgi:hypothetical protein